MKQIYKNDSKQQTLWRFDSLSEFVETAEKGKKRTNYINDTSSWTRHTNWDGAVELARKGWPEGHEKVKASLSGMIKTDRAFEEEQLIRSQSGPMFDVADFIAGFPEPCFDFGIEEGDKSVLKIGCQFSAQGKYSMEAFANRGAVAVALLDALEAARIPTELWAYIAISRWGDSYTIIEFPLKKANEPLDVDLVAYVLGHCGFYRQLGFGVIKYLCHDKKGTYGMDSASSHSIDLDEGGVEYDYDIITPYSPKIKNLSFCKKWLKDVCDKHNVEVELTTD